MVATNEGNFTRALNEFLTNEPGLEGAIAGVSVRSATTGELIYDYHGDTRLKPASNMKLLTAAGALSVLGEEYTFSTKVVTDGKKKWKIIDGNLYLQGEGDPTLLKSDLDQLAMYLRQSGIRLIRGDLIADDSWYDNVRYSLDLPWSDETAYYGAQVSALTVSPNKEYVSGTVVIEIESGHKKGQKASVKLTPETDYISIINKAKTVEGQVEEEITVKRVHGTNHVIIEGEIPIESIEKHQIAVWEPTDFTLALFQQSLLEHGIKVLGEVKRGETPDDTTMLFTHKSIPVSEILIPFMKLSNNGHGETFVKEMGKVVKGEGSWDKGLEVLEEELINLGMKTESMVLRDGSGISHVNLICANELTNLLYIIQSKEWFPTFLNSLPVSGSNEKLVGGTLKNRLEDASVRGRIKAKTGTLATVSSLSGYAESRSGESLIFSILINNLADEVNGKEIEDKIVKLLVND